MKELIVVCSIYETGIRRSTIWGHLWLFYSILLASNLEFKKIQKIYMHIYAYIWAYVCIN